AQGGDPRVLDHPGRLPRPGARVEVRAPRAGVVHALRARPIGHATMLLGAGRETVDSVIDPAVGVWLHKKVGDIVADDEPLCTVLVNEPSRAAAAVTLIRDAYTIGDSPAQPP